MHRQDATKSQFLELAQGEKRAYSIIHLFTHAYADALNAPLSWIHFYSSDAGDSAKLYANELYGLNLPTELSVLGACETDMGKLHIGEGLMSLARGFFCSGSKSVLATSWKVESGPTDSILTRFYGYLQEGFPRDKALQQAKFDFLHQQSTWRHLPSNWAGLRLTGVTRPVFQKATPWWLWALGVASVLLIGFFAFYLYQRYSGG